MANDHRIEAKNYFDIWEKLINNLQQQRKLSLKTKN